MASGQEIDDSSNNNSSPKKVYKDPDDGRQRFLLELEFVQCLANPTYIHCKLKLQCKIIIMKDYTKNDEKYLHYI
ncbi:putative transcription regulator SOH1 family [Helianthus annuus]|nr:putative transcription regulator SOH1 family [Helianthus annuus]